jgi:short-subunit dehydrogenase
MQIAESTTLVTGASGGIGQTIARELRDRGASLVLTGRRKDVLETLAAELGGRPIVAELSEQDAAARLMEEAGPVDILVANAAMPVLGLTSGYTLDEIDRAIGVNLRVPVMMARLAAEQMVARGRGHLVFVSSLAGKAASGGSAIYNATKFGLRGYALALREDLRSHGVGVSIVSPGFIRDAGMLADSGVRLPRGVGTRTTGDVARAVVRAIERDVAEIDVAPMSLLVGAKLFGIAPELMAGVQRRSGATKVNLAIGERLRHRR